MGRILIVEDEVDLAELYRIALEEAGHEIVGIFDNPQIPLLHPPPQLDPEVIVLDERLHGRSGIAFLPLLHSAFPCARVLFASADPIAVDRSVHESADRALKKPFPLIDLVREIHRLLQPDVLT